MVKSSNLDCISSIHNPAASFLNSESSSLHHPTSMLLDPPSTFPSSILLPPSFIKYMGFLTQNVLKIAGISTKGPQALLAPLAAFSRFGPSVKFCLRVSLNFSLYYTSGPSTKDYHHYTLITRFNQNSGPYFTHSLRWTFTLDFTIE